MSGDAEQRKLAAIMFTDMVGYSAMAQKNEAIALELLEEHRQLLRTIFPKHHGQEIETAGDSFLVEHASALEATECALDIQQQIGGRNLTVPSERQIQLRIGIHVGDVVHKDGKVMGDAVNIAARIYPMAEPGGICVTRAVSEQIQGKLSEPLISIPSVKLKNLARPLEVFRVQMPRRAKPEGASQPGPKPPSGSVAQPAAISAEARLELSRMRHELRTPINHILGYCELLLEEAQLPASFSEDLRRIHTGGRQLQSLMAQHFSEDTFFQPRDLPQLYHEFRTPVNQIIGYSELLIDQAQEQGLAGPIADLEKIRDAAGNWLMLIETYLIDPCLAAVEAGSDLESARPQGPRFGLSLGFHLPAPASAASEFRDEGAILIVDDDEANRVMLARRLRRYGYTVSVASSGMQGLNLARVQELDLVLLDMIMPGLDGFQVLAKFKAEPRLRNVPVVMLSALDDENGIARAIELGAEDYLAKPFNPIFLRARIGACLERKRLRDKERAAHEALQRSQKHLSAELAKAAAYVRSLLPAPLTGQVRSDWFFQPCEHLGGDAFGYHWVDPHHLAIYLLDVCGHGVGAALLSVSVLNSVRTQGLSGVDFRDPAAVLSGLNRSFRMETQNNLFFTMWYGVYRQDRRELAYASGGHPPALLLTPKPDGLFSTSPLGGHAPALGCLDESTYQSRVQPIPLGARLLVYSDGVFEIFEEAERVGTWESFFASFNLPEVQRLPPAEHWKAALRRRGAPVLEDDFALLELTFV
jgi:sigma-B regulation protein RsbU (phosphoserine phosphatase)